MDNQDAGNYEKYDGEYPHMPYWGIQALQSIRSSFGDGGASSYAYWIDRYDADESKSVAQLYIYFSWVAYVGQSCFYGIFVLNYLVAIVGDTYGNIMENQQLAVVRGRDELNA